MLSSDLQILQDKLSPSAISAETERFNNDLIEVMKAVPRWWEVGVERYRQMRKNGETPLPKPVELKEGKNITVPSREQGREIPCRVFTPAAGKPKGVFFHIHGGGWVLQDEKAQDVLLKYMADHTQLAVVSGGYRKAPEHPYPAGNEDCFDVAEYLVDNAEKEFGGPLLIMSGESAGGHLTVVTALHLLESRPKFAFKAIIPHYGCFDISGFTPQARNFKLPLVLDLESMERFSEAYLPGSSEADRRDPKISPLFADLTKVKCPPALFTCGTLDLLLDDSVFMATKWMMSGASTILKLYPGAPHGFTIFPPTVRTETVKQCLDDTTQFIKDVTGDARLDRKL